MFNKNNFCHIASNNRNEKKAGVFVYKTTDNLATVAASGYFNDKIVDINLHDLIIHEWHDPTDRTKVQKNVLCVIERTLDNVGTVVIKTKWEEDIEQTIEDLQEYVDNTFVRKDGTSVMTGPLLMRATDNFKCAIAPYWDGIGFFKLNDNNSVTLMASLEYEDGLTPAADNTYNLGTATKRWKDARIARVITAVINNGYDIAVPVTNSPQTLALKSEVDLAANSGRMITAQGVWYAKMYAGTVPPAADDDTNYADFSQTDGQGNPIIVTYTRTNGAWVQDQTITPPAEYDGYVPITSKIWDIPEQAGQQGGRILWNHQSKEFTPYPQIISFENAALTGTPTAPTLNASSPSDQIVNKQTLENALINHGTGRNVGDIFFTMRTDSALNGAVECNGATYNTTDFTGAQSIGQLLADGKVPYVSLADYATALAADGSVGVFGWDGVGNTAFRVPSMNDIFIESGTAAQIGDYIAPGLPNIKGAWNDLIAYYNTHTASGAIQGTGLNDGAEASVVGSPKQAGYTFDASRSSSVYKDTVTTVQPNTIRYRPMVQVAISASDEAVETCTGVLADVADLKDLSNITATAKEVIAHNAMPSNIYTDLTLGASGATYTAPADGYVAFCKQSSGTNQNVNIQANGMMEISWAAGSAWNLSVNMPVKKGDIFAVEYTTGGATQWFRFIYAQGAQ